MGSLDDAIQRGIDRAAIRWMDEHLPRIVDEACGKNLPLDAPRNERQFIWWMGRFFAHTDPTMGADNALALARETLRRYLAEIGAPFGDPLYSWTGDAAEIVAREMETDHWETRP